MANCQLSMKISRQVKNYSIFCGLPFIFIDLDRAANRGLVSMVVLASADALCAPVTPIMDWIPPP